MEVGGLPRAAVDVVEVSLHVGRFRKTISHVGQVSSSVPLVVACLKVVVEVGVFRRGVVGVVVDARGRGTAFLGAGAFGTQAGAHRMTVRGQAFIDLWVSGQRVVGVLGLEVGVLHVVADAFAGVGAHRRLAGAVLSVSEDVVAEVVVLLKDAELLLGVCEATL